MSALITTDHAIEFGMLPKAARADLSFWRTQLEPVLRLDRGTTAALEDIARLTGAGKTTVIRKFYALQKHGIFGLVDRRLAGPRWWKTAPESTVLPPEDQALVKLYCEGNDRSSRAAIKQLRKDWRQGKVKTTQPVVPGTGHPRGWSIDNLARYASEKYELEAARKGTAPAAAFHRLVYTTRAELWVGSHFMFDDMWHDFFVNSFAEKQAGRPLELFSHDLFSGRKVRWGIRVRTQKDDGKMNGLTEAMTRYIAAATFYLDGYSPRGTTCVVEHGTAAFNDDVERALHEHSGGLVAVDRSGFQGAAAHSGQYDGVRRGNPRHKASLESSNNLTHNVFGHLPGQTGMSVEDRPEQLGALLKENTRWLALFDRLSPASQALVQFALLEVNQFMGVARELYAQIENDPDHDLEGWVQAGNVANELLLGGQWVDQRVVMGATEHEQALALSLIGSGKLQTRPRRMTRREAWDRGAGELVKLDGAGVVAILGEDLARPNPEPVRKGMFEFEDQEVGPGTFRFEGIVFDPRGRRERLNEGEKYRVFINPFAPERLFVCDTKLAYLGEAKRIVDPSRANVEAVHRTMGAVAAEAAERLAGLRERHAGQGHAKAERERINLALEAGAPVTEDQHAAAKEEQRAAKAEERADEAAVRLGAAMQAEVLGGSDAPPRGRSAGQAAAGDTGEPGRPEEGHPGGLPLPISNPQPQHPIIEEQC